MTAIQPRRRATRCGLAAAALLLVVAFAGCAAPTVGSGAFRNAADVPTKLQRGVSTKTDVQALLGVPNGGGSSLFRNVAGGPREIWYYEDIETVDYASRSGRLVMTLRQQLLLVFFKGDRFDGYLWTTNAAPPA